MRQEARGFTLVELVVTLAVMTVLLGIGVPSFQRLQQGTRTATTFHLLTTSLALARMAAVKNHTPVSVCPSSDGRYCRGDTVWEDGWIVYSDPTRAKQPVSADAVLHSFDRVGPGLALRSTIGRTLVRFHSNGMAHGSNLSVRLCSTKDNTHLGSIIVNNAGRPRSKRYNDTPCPFAH
ncbi:MAG: GspH/FimT family pseudopilin [Lysobacter sp.]